eukprot:Tamp_17852.p2 GENE.Tamp_17852~~Tamp_17852.p2  ORF type:complete len:130 (-),score=18.30 Tamp_17852:251-640(-)
MLTQNSSLEELNLSYNPIGNEGAVELIKALRHNSSLSSLDVGFNAIDDKGILELGRNLKASPFPAKFRLSGVRLSSCWEDLDLPPEARQWGNEQILSLFAQSQSAVNPQDIHLDSVCKSCRGASQTAAG